MKPAWRRCAPCFCTMHLLALDLPKGEEVCGIGKGTDGSSSILMAPGKRLGSARCLRVLICHHRRGVCLRSVRLGTWDRNAERWCVPVRRSCKRIPIAGWQVLGEQAMGITEESCCGDLRSSLRTRLRWVCSPLRPSFVLMDCM